MTELSATPEGDNGAAAAAVRVENAGYVSATPLAHQYRVLKALVLREISARHGETRLGPLLAVLMPVITLSVLIVMFQFRGKAFPSAFPLPVFVITGYPFWQAFQATYTKVMGAAARNDPLLMFPQITQLDIILSTVILDFATNTLVFMVLCFGVIVILHNDPPADPFGVILCLWGCMWIGAAMGMILCALMRTLPLVASFLNVFMRFGMWFSGVLYAVNRLPSFLWPYLRWNPILHLIEGCRHLWNPDFDAPIFSPRYVIAIGFVLTTCGFIVERASRRFVGD